MSGKHFRMVKESEKPLKKDESAVYVHSFVKEQNKGKLMERAGSCKTLYQALQDVSEESGDLNFLGRINEQEKIEYITYKETRKYAEQIAYFILSHAEVTEKEKPIVGICSENRPEWVITEHATYFYSGINCPIYASFGWSATKHIIKETEMNIIVISQKNTEKIAENLEKEEKKTTRIPKVFVLMDSDISDKAHKILKSFGVEMYYFWDIVKRCKRVEKTSQDKQSAKDKPISKKFKRVDEKALHSKTIKAYLVAPEPETVATICYTSGTTGAPKGAMLLHKNFVSVIASFLLLSKKGVFFDICDGNRYLSFLPLAHVFERIVETGLMLSRCEIIYYRGNPKELQKDFTIAKPHYFIGVPRVFNSVKMAIETKAKEKGKVANFIFTYSLMICMIFRNRVIREIFGRTVFKKIRETFGGSVKCMLSGSAPLSPPTALFFEAIFNCPLFEGYGQTETAAGNITTNIYTNEKGVIGVPFPCNKIKLVSRPESNAFIEKNQGEILMQGHSVFYGYYKQDKLTEECFYEESSKGEKHSRNIYNEDGTKWIKTGDIGEITADGNLRIIGRSKEIFKLSQGEYIIPEKIENLILSTKIKGLEDITIVGDSSCDYVIGICTVLSEKKEDQDKIAEDIAKEGSRLVQEGELIKIELPRKYIFTKTGCTIDNGLLTPSAKKIRKKIVTAYSKQIRELYNTA